MPTETLGIRNVPAKQLSELRRAAVKEGVSTEKYIKQVIAAHLERIRRIQRSSFFARRSAS